MRAPKMEQGQAGLRGCGADLQRALLLPNLQQLHAPLLIRRKPNHLTHNVPHELHALLDPALLAHLLGLELTLGERLALVHTDAQIGLGLPHGVTREARNAAKRAHASAVGLGVGRRARGFFVRCYLPICPTLVCRNSGKAWELSRPRLGELRRNKVRARPV